MTVMRPDAVPQQEPNVTELDVAHATRKLPTPTRVATITSSGPGKTVATFEDGERLEFWPPPGHYHAGQTVRVTRSADGSFTVVSIINQEEN